RDALARAQLHERGYVVRLVDARDHEDLVALAQRGRERVDVHAENAALQVELGVRAAEGAHQLDAAADAGEQDVDGRAAHSRGPSKRGIVACPSALTPSRRSTRQTLSASTFASSHSDQ